MFDWMELLAYGLCFIALVGLGVHKARKMRVATTGREAATTSERLSDLHLGAGLGAQSFTVTMVSMFVSVGILTLLAVAILVVLAVVPKNLYVLVGVCALPVVGGALFAVFRLHRWFVRDIDELKS